MKTWEYHFGIHRYSLTSRDSQPIKQFNSLKECQEEANKDYSFYKSIGCGVWFCYALDPEGKRHTLYESEDYDIQRPQFLMKGKNINNIYE